MAKCCCLWMKFLVILVFMAMWTFGTEYKYYKSREGEGECEADGSTPYKGIMKTYRCTDKLVGKLCENDKFCGAEQYCACNHKCEQWRCVNGTRSTVNTTSGSCNLLCMNGGTCRIVNGQEVCKCLLNVNGSRCEFNPDQFCVHPSPCQNNGVCDEENKKCECKDQYTGKFCQVYDGCKPRCNNVSECVLVGNTSTCQCQKEGFTGPNCTDDIDECAAHQSICHTGTCTNTMGNYTCLCKEPFVGRRCETRKILCRVDSCFNGGTCTEGPVTFNCHCAPSYTGRRCNATLFACHSNHCFNGGQCTKADNGRTSCSCSSNFTGTRCETPVSTTPCFPDPCQHGGTCSLVGMLHKCTCPPSWEGVNCTTKKRFCSGIDCNNGSCTEVDTGFRCACSPGFTGVKCNVDIDECSASPCLHGTCLDSSNSYKCLCNKGYTGFNCTDETKDNFCSSNCSQAGCQQECNNHECDFDDGACALGRKDPWENCTESTCWQLFGNGVCDHMCNNAECLYDGQDCLRKPRCEWEEFCKKHYNNSVCDQACNTVECAYDNLDCDSDGDKLLKVPGTLVFIVASTKAEFLKKQEDFERDLSIILRTHVSVESVILVPETIDSERQRRSLKQSLLNVTVSMTNKECSAGCFATTDNAANFLAAKASKGTLNLPVRVMAVKATKGKIDGPGNEAGLSPLLIALICLATPCVAVAVVVTGKRIQSTLWFPEGHRRHASTQMRREPGVGQEGEELSALKGECETSSGSSGSVESSPPEPKRFKPACSGDLNWLQTPLRDPVVDSEASLQSPVSMLSSASLQSPREILAFDFAYGEKNLHMAARHNKLDVARQLVEYGYDVNARDKDGNSPLHIAVQGLADNVFQFLVRNRSCHIDSQSNDGTTPLMEACRSCATFMVEDLVSTAAKVNLSDARGYTALHHAAIVDNHTSAAVLLKNGAKVDAQSVKKGETPLFLAAREGCITTAMVLLANFANRSCADSSDVTPLAIAQQNGHKDIISLLSDYSSLAGSTPSPTHSPPPSLSPTYSDIRPKIVTKVQAYNNYEQKPQGKRKKRQPSRREKRVNNITQTGFEFISYPTPPHRTSIEVQSTLPELTDNVFNDFYGIQDCFNNIPTNTWQTVPPNTNVPFSSCMESSNMLPHFTNDYQIFQQTLTPQDLLDHPFPTPPSVNNEVDSPIGGINICGASPPFLTPSPDSYATTSPESGESIC